LGAEELEDLGLAVEVELGVHLEGD